MYIAVTFQDYSKLNIKVRSGTVLDSIHKHQVIGRKTIEKEFVRYLHRASVLFNIRNYFLLFAR